MIKAILFDLDDTLIQTNFDTFFPEYLKLLGQHGRQYADPEQFIRLVLDTYQESLSEYNPGVVLYERFLAQFSKSIGAAPAKLDVFFHEFYEEHYTQLQSIVQPRPTAPALLDWLKENQVRFVVATNPALPNSSIRQRMIWGNLRPEDYPFELITTMETMRFGKPQPEYYEEILLRLGIEANEAIMVGDSWDDDIIGAAIAGLNTFWINNEDMPASPDPMLIDGLGSFDSFASQVQSGWLNELRPRSIHPVTHIHRLTAFPAIIDHIRRSFSQDVLECCPDAEEWSVRDIICHLRDHEKEEDRRRLERIVIEDNPFLSANYDPWAHAHEYLSLTVDDAFQQFLALRTETIQWLRTLPESTWERPARYSILGPTSFGEMVQFTSEHDRTHLHQMRDAIAYALTVCG